MKRFIASTLIIPVAIASAPRSATATPAAALPAVAACLASIGCGLTVAAAGAVAYFVLRNGNQEQWVPIPMIDDPEALTEEWTETLAAMSPAAAAQRCEALAQAYTHQGGSRVAVKEVRARGNRGQYECVFEAEVG